MIYLFLFNFVYSHSWLDCIGLASTNYNGNEQYFGEEDFKKACIGYPRNYPGRENTQIGYLYTNMLLAKLDDNYLCHEQQRYPIYSPKFPITIVNEGERLKLWWEVDGHSLPKTEVKIYWTGQPNNQLIKYAELNEQNFYTSFNFASKENCMNINNPNSLCWGYLNLPMGFIGTYSFVWLWPWDLNPIGEEYTTCFDILIK